MSENIADVVLGKAADCGYYLIGLNAPNSGIFADVKWSSPHTFEQTANNVRNSNLRLYILPDWDDIDKPKDLKRLHNEILNDKNARRIAPNTAEWLRQNDNLF